MSFFISSPLLVLLKSPEKFHWDVRRLF